jgi:hypothetical protein
MVPHKSHGKGSYVLDRMFPGVGRVCRASGTTNRNTFKALNGMLDTLWSLGRLDVLECIRDGDLHPMVVWSHIRRDGVGSIPTPERLAPLDPGLKDWVDRQQKSAKHKQSLKNSFGRLLKHAPKGATVSDLPELLRKFQDENGSKPRMCNLVRSAVQAFLRSRLGRRHSVYLEVQDVEALAYTPGKGHPVTPRGLAVITAQLQQPYVAMLWSLAQTGMRPDEYFSGKWEPRKDRIEVHGTKTRASERVVPLVGTIVAPACTHQYLHRMLKAVEPKMGLYDMRRSFAHWMEEASISRTRREHYMGHGPKTMTDRYEQHEVAAYLQGDAKRLLKYIGEAQKQVKAG